VALNLPILPAAGDLLGTTISETALTNQNIVNTWAGQDRGVSNSGYVNDAAVGRLVLNALAVPPHSKITFNGTGPGSALYVDSLVLLNNAATFNFASSNVTSLAINSNLVIYYAQALSNGVPVSGVIDGWNNGHLRWVQTYQGLFNSTNIVTGLPSGPPGPFRFTVSGVQLPTGFVANSNYKVVIQAATNLVSPNWVNVYTGTPPFTFTSFGYTTNQQQFYRAKQGWKAAMKVCGLTGGVGMGKSTAAGFFLRHGARVVDTDGIARQLVQPGQPALAEIQNAFGQNFLAADGSLKRDQLARVVFADESARKKLEAILHPRIRETWLAQVEVWRNENCPLAVVVIPLLFETAAEGHFEKIICAACSPAAQRERLAARGWSPEQIRQRIAAQLPVAQKIARAHFVIWTEGALAAHAQQVALVFGRL